MEEGAVKRLQSVMVEPQYRIFKSTGSGNFEEQWESCFNSFKLFIANDFNRKAFIVRVFVAAENTQEFARYATLIKQKFSGDVVPYSILAESPEKPYQVIIEAGFVCTDLIRAEYGQCESLRFCKLSASGYNEYWFAGVNGNAEGLTIAGKASSAFSQLLSAFLQLDLGFNQIVRQWNYVERIYGFEQIDAQQRQNYQLFNEARGEYYSRYRTVPGFPAATGIGVDFGGVTIECMAVSTDENLKSVAICNPKQLNSYTYGQAVLKGEPQRNKAGNQPPQFERARLLTNDQTSRLFISGTASIVGQETIGLNDVEKQTRVTIENMELLSAETNLRSYYPELACIPDRYAYVRVYVKNEADIPVVQAICRNYFGEVPMLVVKADICRADLLVEIEAELIATPKK